MSWRVVDQVHVMGTVVSIDVRAATRPQVLDLALATAAVTLRRLDDLLSTWKPDSWASRLLDGRADVAEAPSAVREVHSLALALEGSTGGWFAPRWRRGLDPGAPGGPDATGLVKGWAAQRVSDLLRTHGLRDHVVNAAGDLVVSGSPLPEEPSQPWRVAVSDPAGRGSVVGVLRLTAGGRWAVATSGPAERGPHVVDPRRGQLARAVVSATAVLPLGAAHRDAGAETDAWATAVVASDGDPVCLSAAAGRGVALVVLGAEGSVHDPHRLLGTGSPHSVDGAGGSAGPGARQGAGSPPAKTTRSTPSRSRT